MANLLDLPVELLPAIILECVQVRSFVRVLRLRLVCQMFKFHVEQYIFRSGALDRVICYAATKVNSEKHWARFVKDYLVYRVLKQESTTDSRGRLRHYAEQIYFLSEEAGDKRSMSDCVRSLVELAFYSRNQQQDELLWPDPSPFTYGDPETERKRQVFHAAVYMDNRALVRLLLAQCPVENWTWRSESMSMGSFLCKPMQIAAREGNIDMIQLLRAADLQQGVIPPLAEDQSMALLYEAARGGHSKTFHFLLDNTEPFTLPHFPTGAGIPWESPVRNVSRAASPDDFKRFKALLPPRDARFWRDCVIAMDDDVVARIDFSTKKNDLAQVRHFLRQGGYVNDSIEADTRVVEVKRLAKKGRTALMRAINAGNDEVVELLLEGGADPNAYSPENTALMSAARWGSVKLARLLLDHGANINYGNPPPIVVAVLGEQTAMFNYLISRGAILDTPDTGPRAMAFAVSLGLDSMVGLLKQHGLDGSAVLHRAAGKREKSCYTFKNRPYDVASESYYSKLPRHVLAREGKAMI